MAIDFLATFSFVCISTFTPGPNNISSAAMGALHGFKRTLPYLLGMVLGSLVMMLVCALAAASVLTLFPGLETGLRYIGAGYTLYLAYGLLKANYAFDSENVKPLGWANGFLLQVFNPKLIVYGLTLFSTYLAPIVVAPVLLVLTVVGLVLIGLCSIVLWAAFGTAIKRYMQFPRARLAVNVSLALFLVYTALDLAF